MDAFFIRRKSEPLIISDIPSLDLDSGTEYSDMTIHSSVQLNGIERHYLLKELENEAEREVALWIQNKRYIPRLIVSAFVFLVSYVLFSFLIRDPLPIIDELLLSSVVAAFFWAFMSKRDSASTAVRERKKKIISKIESGREEIDGEVGEFEDLLSSFDSEDDGTLAKMIVLGNIPEKEFSEKSVRCFSDYIGTKAPHIIREAEKLKKRKRGERYMDTLTHLSVTGALDLGIYALYLTITGKRNSG